MSERSDLLAVLAAATLWGTTGTAATFAPPGTPAIAVGAAAMGIGGMLLFGSRAQGSLAVLRDPAHRPLVLLGGLCLVAYALTFYAAMARAGVALGVTLAIGSAPVLATLYDRILGGRPVPATSLLAISLAIAGAALVGWSRLDLGDRAATEVLIGSALGLCAGVCWAGYSIAGAALVRTGADCDAVIGAIFGLGSLVLVPLALLRAGPLLAGLGGLAVLAYLALVPMLCGYSLFGRGLRSAGAGLLTTLALIEVAVAAILAQLVANQSLPAEGWAGIGMVGIAVLLLVG